jgi:hypothetical protein
VHRPDRPAGPDRTGAGIPLTPVRHAVGAAPDAQLVDHRDEPGWAAALARWVPPAPRTPAGRLLAVAWASPASLAGLLVGVLSGVRPVVRDGVLLFAHVRGLPRWALRRGGYAATTLGHVVLALRDPPGHLMAHELVHTRQAERLGPLMALLYWGLLARHGYARHPMERAARRAGLAARRAAGGRGATAPGGG